MSKHLSSSELTTANENPGRKKTEERHQSHFSGGESPNLRTGESKIEHSGDVPKHPSFAQ
jgi:hypothetical protein